MNRRFPARKRRPRRADAGRSRALTGSPSSATPPCWMSRRASLRDPTPSASTSSAGRWISGEPRGNSRTSGGRRRPPAPPRAVLLFAWGPSRRRLMGEQQPVVLVDQPVGDAHDLAELLLGPVGD